MIPREILEQALADYEKAVEKIQGMEDAMDAVGYLERNMMNYGLCYYIDAKFDMCETALVPVFGVGFWAARGFVMVKLPMASPSPPSPLAFNSESTN